MQNTLQDTQRWDNKDSKNGTTMKHIDMTIKKLIYALWMCHALNQEQIQICQQLEGEMLELEVKEVVEWDK